MNCNSVGAIQVPGSLGEIVEINDIHNFIVVPNRFVVSCLLFVQKNTDLSLILDVSSVCEVFQ